MKYIRAVKPRIVTLKDIIKRTISFFTITLLLTLPLLLSGCSPRDFHYGRARPMRGRVGQLKYYFVVKQKPSETLQDVTLYLPFPRDEDTPLEALVQASRWSIGIFYDEKEDPNVSLKTVDTKYGKMLKVRISKMDSETGSVSIHGECVYSTLLPFGRADKDYPLMPMTQKGSNSSVPVYAEYEGGTGFYFWLVYSAESEDHYLPVMPESQGSSIILGTGATVSGTNPSTFKNDSIWINKQGWQKLSAWRSSVS